MHFSTVLAFASTTIAVPLVERQDDNLCTGGMLYTQAQCCKTDVLDVADLDCKNPLQAASTTASFGSICAAEGRTAKCCSIPVAGLALLCNDFIDSAAKTNAASVVERQDGGALCPAGLYSNPQCCVTDVLGILDVDCKTPSSRSGNVADFQEICSKSAKSAKCCVLPIASQDVLCQDAV